MLFTYWICDNREPCLRACQQRAAPILNHAKRSDTAHGWPGIASMSSDAYATGQALVALNAAGVAPSDPVYQRGVNYLLSTQLQDGSWFQKRRALPVQPYFDNGFPHGDDQWISVSATNWAVIALSLAAPNPATKPAGL